tara:strand:- start:151 stop:1185 length:1035 start_codon:yes stop_codon:yes gene_type:complete
MLKTQIMNSQGENIVLNDVESRNAERLTGEIQNALGFEVDITTLTGISKSIVEQKFFELAPADYMPLRVGDNAWTQEVLTYKDFSTGGDFEEGVINTNANNSRLAETDGGVEGIKVPVINWAKGISWSIFDLKFASQSGNWDIVSSKERSRKKNWDLGIQKIAFVGSNNNASVKGLLTQANVTANTAIITKYIKDMTASEFNTFLADILGAYRTNAKNTTYPTHFVIPEADYLGLASMPDATYPLRTKLDILEDSFKRLTRNQSFQVLPCAYADVANNATITDLNKNRYTLYNFDEDSGRMELPVDYSNTLANTINGVNFQNGAYGQYTGFQAFRDREFLYFDF